MLYSEVIDGAIVQTVDANDSISTSTGSFPFNWDKSLIPNLYPVTMAERPDPSLYDITGYDIVLTNGVPTQILHINSVPPAPPAPTPTTIVLTLKQIAQRALTASDRTLLRCVEKNIAFPSDWVSYRDALRVSDLVMTNLPSGTAPSSSRVRRSPKNCARGVG